MWKSVIWAMSMARARDYSRLRAPQWHRGPQGTPRPSWPPVLKPVARARFEIQAVDALQLGDPLQRRWLERLLSLEGVKDDALDKIAQRHFPVFRQRLQHLEQA